MAHREIVPLEEPEWTTPLKRHVGVKVSHCDVPCYAKLAIAKDGDLDEPDLLEGMRREVWWSRVIHRLRQENPSFPFTSPRVIATNVNQYPFQDEVAWVIMEFIEGQPIVDWEPEQTTCDMNDNEVERFDRLFDAVIRSLVALEGINLDTLADLGLAQLPPFLPHGSRGSLDRWQQKLPISRRLKNTITTRLENRARHRILQRPTQYSLGNGAFEIKNFWRTRDGQLVIMDNEFAGWYPMHDHLSYLYHRLYCNTMRPDLAKRLLSAYVDRKMLHRDHFGPLWKLFFADFARILKPRLLGGWYYDTVRRKLMPWHEKQRLRYELYWSLLRGEYNNLTSD